VNGKSATNRRHWIHGLIAGARRGRPLAAPLFPDHPEPMPTTRRSLPLALTIAVHLLLAACLYLARRHPPPNSPPSRQSVLILLGARPLAAPPTTPASGTVPRTSDRHAPPRPLPHPSESDTPAPVSGAAAAAPAPELLPPGAGEIVARARRDAGKIDRALRAATPLPSFSADSSRARFERAMAAAWIDRSNSVVEDRYVSPDGVVITRLTRNGGTACYMSGTVNFVPGILHDSARPQSVNCPPADSGWSRR
jgi:hypothetical protein